jgi:hypothetical protein
MVLIPSRGIGKAIPVQAYYRPRGFQMVETPRFPADWHMVALSTLWTGRLTPQEIVPVLISVTG